MKPRYWQSIVEYYHPLSGKSGIAIRLNVLEFISNIFQARTAENVLFCKL